MLEWYFIPVNTKTTGAPSGCRNFGEVSNDAGQDQGGLGGLMGPRSSPTAVRQVQDGEELRPPQGRYRSKVRFVD